MAKRYDQMLPLIAEHRPRRIVEVGVHRALRAMKLCQEALKYRDWVSYTGYDVFETMNPKFQEAALNGKGTALQAEAEGRLRTVHGLEWQLIVGDTRDTLHGTEVEADFAFIDGDHRVEAIAGDYTALRNVKVVVFDDYYLPDESGNTPDLSLYGANATVDAIKDASVVILPTGDRCKHGGFSRLAVVIRD
jgi:hypothetical protein